MNQGTEDKKKIESVFHKVQVWVSTQLPNNISKKVNQKLPPNLPQTNMAASVLVSSSSRVVDHASFVRSSEKLHGLWSKKVGTRLCTASRLFVPEPASPHQHVAYLMTNYLNALHGRNKHLVQGIKNLWDVYKSTQVFHVEFPYEHKFQFWVYDTRKTDFLPRTQRDMEKLVAFVDFLLTYDESHITASTRDYLRKHITMTASYLIFYLTKPDFFHIVNETQYTTRRGTQRTWFPILLNKFPKKMEKKEKKEHNKYKSESTDLVHNLPRLREKYGMVCEKIHDLFDKHYEVNHYLVSHTKVDLDDLHSMNHCLSEYITPTNPKSLPQGKAKKLQKMMQELQKIAPKIRELEKRTLITDAIHDSLCGANVKKVRPQTNHPTTPNNTPLQSASASSAEEEEDDVPDDWEDALI